MSALDHLSQRHRTAVDEAVAYVRTRYEPWGILAAGTIISGEPDPRSDIDLYVLHDEPFRQRVQRWFAETPVEIFVNPEATVLGYIESEERDGRPLTAHMLLTGVVAFTSNDDRLERLRVRAAESLESPPEWDAATLVRGRYAAATMIEDALDRREADPGEAIRLLGRGVQLTLEDWFKRRREYYPRSKILLREVFARDPAVGELCQRFWGDADLSTRFDAGLRLADAILGTRGFFEWESDRQPI